MCDRLCLRQRRFVLDSRRRSEPHPRRQEAQPGPGRRLRRRSPPSLAPAPARPLSERAPLPSYPPDARRRGRGRARSLPRRHRPPPKFGAGSPRSAWRAQPEAPMAGGGRAIPPHSVRPRSHLHPLRSRLRNPDLAFRPLPPAPRPPVHRQLILVEPKPPLRFQYVSPKNGGYILGKKKKKKKNDI